MGAHAHFNALTDREFIRKVSEMVVADFPAGPVNWDGEHVHPHVLFFDLNLDGIDVSARRREFPVDLNFLAAHVSCLRSLHHHGWGTAARAGGRLLHAFGLSARGEHFFLVRIESWGVDCYLLLRPLLASFFLGHERNLLLCLHLSHGCGKYDCFDSL
jgi:hypothetical protein